MSCAAVSSRKRAERLDGSGPVCGSNPPSSGVDTSTLRHLINITWAPASLEECKSSKQALYFLIREVATGGSYGFGGVSMGEAVASLRKQFPRLTVFDMSPGSLSANFFDAVVAHPLLMETLTIKDCGEGIRFVSLPILKKCLYCYLQNLRRTTPDHHKEVMAGLHAQISPRATPVLAAAN
eukprot:TRINITY_DN2426_c0_g1_i1.p1 TRINITY_DN2426_c0_g1~~TRINITY_DN2426_c0_g1_i1.p1  ORF type:complete len:181 (-),score=25.98 TRINITY_DN2426_c0_g1_i1:158-700(-)